MADAIGRFSHLDRRKLEPAASKVATMERKNERGEEQEMKEKKQNENEKEMVKILGI